MKSRSLTTQTVVVSLGAQIVCALVLCAAALLHETRTRMHALDAQIQGRSDSLLGAVQDAEDPDANVTIDPTELKLPPNDVFAVYNQGGRMLGSSPNAPASLTARSNEGFRAIRLSSGKYRIFQREAMRVIDRAENRGVGLRRPVTLVYAAPEGHVRHEIFEAAGYDILTILLTTGGMAVLLPYLLRRTLKPLSDVAEATEAIRAPAFEFKPPASALGLRELSTLTEMLTASMSRVQLSFAREHQFVSDAAHELKTAVAVVRSSVQVLLLKPRSEKDYTLGLGRIVDDVERLESLIAQMLDLARVEETSAADVPVIDFGETVAAAAAALQPVAEERALTVQVEAPSGLRVRLQREAAEALVFNLLLNALQHSAAASPPVTVSVYRTGAGQVALQVTDHGDGISREALPHIFERFYREDKSRSRETGGTGLGLAIAKSIVESAHGSIRAESTRGFGTTMLVTFTPA